MQKAMLQKQDITLRHVVDFICLANDVSDYAKPQAARLLRLTLGLMAG